MPTSMRSWVLTVVIPLFVMLLQGTAVADSVDRLMTQLEDDSDDKVRVSAAINLGKLGDQRAVPALTSALSDSKDTVLGAAATSLGMLVNAKTDQKTRKGVLDELGRLAKRDTSSLVRKAAQRAYDRIRKLPTQSAPTGGINVNIGSMATKAAKGA